MHGTASTILADRSDDWPLLAMSADGAVNTAIALSSNPEGNDMDVRMYAALLALCAGCMVGALGCADGTGAAVQREDPFSALTSDELFQQQPTSYFGDSNTNDSTALVSVSTPEPAPTLIELGHKESLNSVINRASGPVLLDFFADWCGPCRAQGKILHRVGDAAAQSGTLIIKINVDEHRELAEELNVSSLPTLMMVKDGRVVERRSGLTEAHLLTAWMR